MEGTITLQEAKAIGRDGVPAADTSQASGGPGTATRISRSASNGGDQDRTPPPPVSRISKDDRSRLCICGCENRTRGGRFRPGHDMRLVTYAKEYIRGERELTDEQLEYVTTSGKLERVRKQVEKADKREIERAAKRRGAR